MSALYVIVADITHRIGIKSQRKNQSKAERLNAAKQVRDKKRAETMHAKRMAAFLPPRVVAILPLSAQANFGLFWNKLVHATQHSAESADDGNAMEEDMSMTQEPKPITMVASRQKKIKLTILPPLMDVTDPFAVVDLGKCADMLICLIPSADADDIAIDSAGSQALSILRSLGLPSTLAIAQSGSDSMNLKERSAAKKRASEALSALLPSDHYKMMLADSAVDYKQIVRHLVETTPVVPIWRTQRSHIIPQKAEFVRSEKISSSGTLLLTGYVRNRALSANQVIHIPSAGDFQIEKIETVINEDLKSSENRPGAGQMETEEVLAVSAPEEREPLTRENEVDLLDAEQTWPTEEELAEAEKNASMRKRRLPKGTSDYQAAWIVDDDFSDISDEEDNDPMHDGLTAGGVKRNEDAMHNPWIEDDVGTDFDPEEVRAYWSFFVCDHHRYHNTASEWMHVTSNDQRGQNRCTHSCIPCYCSSINLAWLMKRKLLERERKTQREEQEKLMMFCIQMSLSCPIMLPPAKGWQDLEASKVSEHLLGIPKKIFH